MVGTQGSDVNQAQSLEEVMVAEGLSFLERTCNTAQCSGCQLGCSGGQNLPCSIYRRIICSCSYCMEHPKILLYQLLEQIILFQQNPQYAPGSCYSSILSSCSHYLEHILLKVAKLEFENHKNQYLSWLLRSEHVKTNIFGNRMTKLTI